MRLIGFRILTFDVYGTLIDWESGMIAGLKPLTDRVPGLSRDEILEAHALHESQAQAQTPGKLYPDVLALVFKRLAEGWGVPASREECLRYGESVRDWPAFPDSAEALAYLKQHFALAVLSNVDNASFAHSSGRLGVAFDAAYVAEDVGSYKPAQRNFDYMLADLERRGFAKGEILHVAESMFHDHGPANAAGLANCWIHRRHDKEGFGATMRPDAMPETDFRFRSMAELVEAHRAETGTAA